MSEHWGSAESSSEAKLPSNRAGLIIFGQQEFKCLHGFLWAQGSAEAAFTTGAGSWQDREKPLKKQLTISTYTAIAKVRNRFPYP